MPVVRLPPYHPDLNPIEEVWGFTKRNIASKNVSQSKSNTLKIIYEEMENVTSDQWFRCCKRVEEIEETYRQQATSPDNQLNISEFIEEDALPISVQKSLYTK